MIGALGAPARYLNSRTVKGIVVAAVLELFAYRATNLEVECRCHCHVPSIE